MKLSTTHTFHVLTVNSLYDNFLISIKAVKKFQISIISYSVIMSRIWYRSTPAQKMKAAMTKIFPIIYVCLWHIYINALALDCSNSDPFAVLPIPPIWYHMDFMWDPDITHLSQSKTLQHYITKQYKCIQMLYSAFMMGPPFVGTGGAN